MQRFLAQGHLLPTALTARQTNRDGAIPGPGADGYRGRMDLRTSWRERAGAESVIVSPEQHTVIEDGGAVRSIQVALVTLPEVALREMWQPMYLERLARTYWTFLSRATLGLVRVAYSPGDRAVVLIGRPLVLLRFRPPEYDFGSRRGVVRWRIRDGLLVARHGHESDGYLEIDVRRRPCAQNGRARVRVQVEVANFYPAVAGWFTRGFYRATQARIHVLVTHGFLRSLESLHLDRSAVGRFDPDLLVPREDRLAREGRPWALAALAVGAGGALVLAGRRRRSGAAGAERSYACR
jgi:hypothetical protein